MKFFGISILAVVLFAAITTKAADSTSASSAAVLFVHDSAQKYSAFYVNAVAERIKNSGRIVKEESAEGASNLAASPYRTVVLYGVVMAFNMKSEVRHWLKSVQSFKNKRVFILVTANRWFKGSLLKDLVTLSAERGGSVVDAVSMATNKMSDAEKLAKIDSCLAKLGQ
jgi:hypothetical protein